MRQIRFQTNSLDEEQCVQIDRAVSYFNKSQSVLRLNADGICDLPLTNGYIDVDTFYKGRQDANSDIIVTGRGLSDNWFSHSINGHGLITLADWQIAFIDQSLITASAAPDAHILTSLVLTGLSVLANIEDFDILHEDPTGCLFDFCQHKPDRILKMRSAFICQHCIDTLAQHGISSTEIDAAHAILECVRNLVLGRQPQKIIPQAPDDEAFIQKIIEETPFQLPPRLVSACKERSLTLLIGSGMSLQTDIEIAYLPTFEWRGLPSWTDIPLRLADCLKTYTGRSLAPRECFSLDEFLVEMDAFRASLGEGLYYSRAIFDIFTPEVKSVGLANRLVYRLPIKSVITTNYDTVLQSAAPSGSPVFTWKEAKSAREYMAGCSVRKPIIKIHGCATRPDTVVLTAYEYYRLSANEDYRAMMRSLFENHTILFLGFGFNDPKDLDFILREAELAGASGGDKFAVLPEERCADVRQKFMQVQTIGIRSHEEVPAFIAALVAASGSN